MSFNWEDFKKNNIVVHCDTKEKAEDFIKRCKMNGIKWITEEEIDETENDYAGFQSHKENTYYEFNIDGLFILSLAYIDTADCNIIEWEIENNTDIHYDKKYTIQEMFQFNEGTEFEYKNCLYRIIKGILEVNLYKVGDEWEQCNCISKGIINAKFKLVKKDKNVTFMEAIKLYNEHNPIKCMWLGNTYEFKGDDEANLINLEEERLLNLILDGEWYVKEN